MINYKFVLCLIGFGITVYVLRAWHSGSLFDGKAIFDVIMGCVFIVLGVRDMCPSLLKRK